MKRFVPAAIVIVLTAAATVLSLQFGPTRLGGAAGRDKSASPESTTTMGEAQESETASGGAARPDSATRPVGLTRESPPAQDERAGPARDPSSQRVSQGALSRYAFDARNPLQFQLPQRLHEVSGLAVTERGTLFAHQDERAVVFEIDPKVGKIVKSFRVGSPALTGDFEGVATVGRRNFLISSEGTLYEFEEAAPDSSAQFQRHALATRDQCTEIEGLEYDSRSAELWLACKTPRGRELRSRLIVFAVSLATMTLQPAPRFSLSLDILAGAGLDAELSPTGLAIHPVTGTLFLVAQQDVIVELDRSGRLLGVAELARRLHPQPEGIAFAPDGTLYIANEAGSGRANLTVYPVRPADGAERQ